MTLSYSYLFIHCVSLFQSLLVIKVGRSFRSVLVLCLCAEKVFLQLCFACAFLALDVCAHSSVRCVKNHIYYYYVVWINTKILRAVRLKYHRDTYPLLSYTCSVYYSSLCTTITSNIFTWSKDCVWVENQYCKTHAMLFPLFIFHSGQYISSIGPGGGIISLLCWWLPLPYRPL